MKPRKCPQCGVEHRSVNPYCAEHAHMIDRHEVKPVQGKPLLFEEDLDSKTEPEVTEDVRVHMRRRK